MSDRTALYIMDRAFDPQTGIRYKQYCSTTDCPCDSHQVSNCCDLIASFTICGRWNELADQNPAVENLCFEWNECQDKEISPIIRNLLQKWRPSIELLNIQSMRSAGSVIPPDGLPALREITCRELDGATAEILFNKSPNLRSIKCQTISGHNDVTDWSKVPAGVQVIVTDGYVLTLHGNQSENLNNMLKHTKSVTLCASEVQDKEATKRGFDAYRKSVRDKKHDFRLGVVANYDVQDLMSQTKDSVQDLRIGNATISDIGLMELQKGKRLQTLVLSMHKSADGSKSRVTLKGLNKFVKQSFTESPSLQRFEFYDRMRIPDQEQKELMLMESELQIEVFSFHHLCGTWSLLTASHGDVRIEGLLFRRKEQNKDPDEVTPVLPTISSVPHVYSKEKPDGVICPPTPKLQKPVDKNGCRGQCTPSLTPDKENSPPVTPTTGGAEKVPKREKDGKNFMVPMKEIEQEVGKKPPEKTIPPLNRLFNGMEKPIPQQKPAPTSLIPDMNHLFRPASEHVSRWVDPNPAKYEDPSFDPAFKPADQQENRDKVPVFAPASAQVWPQEDEDEDANPQFAPHRPLPPVPPVLPEAVYRPETVESPSVGSSAGETSVPEEIAPYAISSPKPESPAQRPRPQIPTDYGTAPESQPELRRPESVDSGSRPQIPTDSAIAPGMHRPEPLASGLRPQSETGPESETPADQIPPVFASPGSPSDGSLSASSDPGDHVYEEVRSSPDPESESEGAADARPESVDSNGYEVPDSPPPPPLPPRPSHESPASSENSSDQIPLPVIRPIVKNVVDQYPEPEDVTKEKERMSEPVLDSSPGSSPGSVATDKSQELEAGVLPNPDACEPVPLVVLPGSSILSDGRPDGQKAKPAEHRHPILSVLRLVTTCLCGCACCRRHHK